MLTLFPLTPTTKVFPDEAPRAEDVRTAFSGFQNEVIAFQAACTGDENHHAKRVSLTAESPLSGKLRIRAVEPVPVRNPIPPDADNHYLRKTPGLYPDVLRDAPENPRLGSARLYAAQSQSWFVDIDPDGTAPGDYPVVLHLSDAATGEEYASVQVTVTVLPGMLPPQRLMRTHWFHADCLAEYYHVPVFSEEHWRILENFIRTAVKRGCTMLLTPIFTPPLDTAVGGERLTVQLVDVEKCGNDWLFGFSRLERWVEMCKRCGVRQYEISHLFSQWGAKYAPKIMGMVDGKEQRIFGWETDVRQPEYKAFLAAFLPALLDELEALGVLKDSVFHISDEPVMEHLESYSYARSLVLPYLRGCTVMDALSDFAFYQTGTVPHPVVAVDHIGPFLDAGVPGLWAYYCCGQYKDVTNALIAMPSARTRILGVQLYVCNISGFLQWGYNFYHSELSLRNINPYETVDADGFFPAGDPFLVYPGEDGQPVESLRLMVMLQAMQDLRTLEMLEALRGREHVLALIEDVAGGKVTLTSYPRDAAFFDRLLCRARQEILK